MLAGAPARGSSASSRASSKRARERKKSELGWMASPRCRAGQWLGGPSCDPGECALLLWNTPLTMARGNTSSAH